MILQAKAGRAARTYRPLVLQSGTVVRTVEELLGHTHVCTTMIYTQGMKVASGGTASPLDAPT